jgi:hypothetical protein
MVFHVFDRKKKLQHVDKNDVVSLRVVEIPTKIRIQVHGRESHRIQHTEAVLKLHPPQTKHVLNSVI